MRAVSSAIKRSLCVALFPLLNLSGCRQALTPAEAPAPPAVESSIVVQTVAVRRGEIAQVITAPGSLVARRESRIGTEVSGRILRIFVEEGDRIQAGAPLFEIDPAPYEMAVRQASAGLDLARAEERQIDADLQRASTLRKQQVVAQQDIDRLTTQLTVSRARVRQAEEALALARHNLERTVVPAPYAGSIAHRLVDEGTTALVQPQTIVVVIQETAELEARAAIPESHLSSVRVGDTAVVQVEGAGAPITTTLSAVSDTIDPATRTYLVKARVPNPDHLLKAGVFAAVEIHPQPKHDALLIPRQAVRTEDGRTRVMTVRDGYSEAVPVEIGLLTEEVAEVTQGLAEGEIVVAGSSARHLAPGMRVRVAAAAAEPPS
jgi:RND family efflux transporter MFP subunit